MGKRKKKLKKRIKRANKLRELDPRIMNEHHLLWVGANWDKNKYSRLLRSHWYLRVNIPKNTLHKQIHIGMNGVPIPSENNCKRALNVLYELEANGALSEKHNISERIRLLLCLFSYVEPATEKALKKQLHIINEFYNGSP